MLTTNDIVYDLCRRLEMWRSKLSALHLTHEQARRAADALKETTAVVWTRDRGTPPADPTFAMRLVALSDKKRLAEKELAADYVKVAEINNAISTRKAEIADLQVGIEANLKLAREWGGW